MSVTAKRGGKITDSHATMTETSAEVVGIANRLPEVTKISLGHITHVPKGRRAIKFLPITGGIMAKVRGSGAVHEIYIYTKEPGSVSALISKHFIESP